MIKDIFVLKKNSWHAKMMRWIWGHRPENFRNMCPYFWLSIFNILIVIPFSIIKLIILGIKSIGRALEEANNDRKENWQTDFIKSMEEGDEDSIYKLCSFMDNGDFYYRVKGNQKRKYWDLYKWFDDIDSDKRTYYREKYREITLKLAKEREEREAEQRLKRIKAEEKLARKGPRKSREQRIGELTIKIKFIAKIFGIIAIIAFCYFSYLGVVWMTTLNWSIIWDNFLDGLLIAVLIFGLISAIYVLYEWISYIGNAIFNYCFKCEKRRKRIGNFLTKMFSWTIYLTIPFIWLWKGLCWIGRKLASFWELLMAIKSNNCPGIDWKE